MVESSSEKPARPEDIKLFQTVEDLAPELWEDLEKRPLAEVVAGSGASFDPESGFSVPYMGSEYRINVKERAITGPIDHRPPDFQKALTLLSYLTHAQDFGLSGRQVTARELSGGAMFFKGPHGLLTEPVTCKFGNNPEALLAKATSLGLKPLESGSGLACCGPILPHLALGFFFHPQDDEFPAELTYTFDSYAHHHLPLDAIWAMVNSLAHELSF